MALLTKLELQEKILETIDAVLDRKVPEYDKCVDEKGNTVIIATGNFVTAVTAAELSAINTALNGKFLAGYFAEKETGGLSIKEKLEELKKKKQIAQRQGEIDDNG